MKTIIQRSILFFFLIAAAMPLANAQEDSMKGMDMPKPAPTPAANPHEGMDMGKKSGVQTTSPKKGMEEKMEAQKTVPMKGIAMEPSSRAAKPVAETPDLPIPKATGPVAYGLPPHLVKGWHPPVMDQNINTYVVADKLEYGIGRGADLFIWDMQGWVGDDYNKFWWKTEGQQQVSREVAGEIEVQALYSRLVAPFWFAQAGIRRDQDWGLGVDRGRTFGVLGFEGLAPYKFDLEPALFISEDGDISARLTATYDMLLTQQLVLQPRFDVNAAVQSAEKYGVAEGLNDVELALRLRYEITRQFAPYVGVSWLRRIGETADLARQNGDGVEDFRIVLGIRVWF